MSKTYSAGIVTAYGAAKRAGYHGTYEDFCRQQAGYAESAAAVEAAKTAAQTAANTATTKATEATTAATAAQTAKTQTEQSASQALTDIATARSGAISALQTEGATQTSNATAQALAAAQSANTASTKASEASASATTATTKATEAAASATSAAQSASDAQDVLDSIPADYSDLSANVSQLQDDLNTIDMVIGASTTASRTIDNTATTITNISSKVDITAKKGDTLIVNVSGTAFTKTSCFLYLFYGESTTATSAGSVTIGQDNSIVLTDDINAIGIYANNLNVGTIVITAISNRNGLYSDVANILDNIDGITSTVENTESLLYLSSSVYATYEQGRISSTTGKSVDNGSVNWVRTPDFISVDALLSVYKSTTVKIMLFFYDSSYQYLNDYISVTNASAVTYTKQDIVNNHPNAKYIKVAGSLRSSEITTPADYVNTGAYALYIITSQEIIDKSRAEGSQSIPGYYESHMQNKANRINQLAKMCAGTGDVFVFITDEHWEDYNAKNSTSLINYLYHNCHINRLFDGGDTDNNGNESYCNSLRAAFPGKIYHIAGNHEWFNPSDGQDLYYIMDMYNNDQIGNPLEHYYYVDNRQQKIRYIILNAFIRENGSTTVTSGYSTEQLNWLNSVALNVDDGWDVIVFAHWIGTNLSGGVEGIVNFRNALDTFNANSQSGKVLAIIQGHGHYDAVYRTNGGIPIILTTCDKYKPWINNDIDKEPWITQYRQGGTTSDQAFDVYILDRVNNIIRAVRVGAKAMDNYAPYSDTNFAPAGALDERIVHYEKINVSNSITLTPTITGTITWKSENEAIATVSNGIVSAIDTGTVIISAVNDSYQAEIWVIVT